MLDLREYRLREHLREYRYSFQRIQISQLDKEAQLDKCLFLVQNGFFKCSLSLPGLPLQGWVSNHLIITRKARKARLQPGQSASNRRAGLELLQGAEGDQGHI